MDDTTTTFAAPDTLIPKAFETLQGTWSAEQYLRISERTNRLIEFDADRIVELPMPTEHHQGISRFLFLILYPLLERLGGAIYYAPLCMFVAPNRYREPDILLLLDKNDPRRANRFWTGADLVVEIVSPDDSDRDLVTKRADYAVSRIAEYWIVDPEIERFVVLTLDNAAYAEHGVFLRGQTVTSLLLPNLTIDVSATFDAE